ncbi:hypothetical protein HJFPF1_06523 [Paramyrothecium foliicola]|nr:hypothetical protein HJFPF1_06523 [Paramyrothecium foliicola]
MRILKAGNTSDTWLGLAGLIEQPACPTAVARRAKYLYQLILSSTAVSAKDGIASTAARTF